MSQPEVSPRSKWRERGAPKARSAVAATPPERLMIVSVSPSVSEGTYPSKRVQHDIVEFSATVVSDSHVTIGAQLRLISPDGTQQTNLLERDIGYRFSTTVELDQLGVYEYVVDAWIDRAETMRSRISRKQAAGQPTSNEEEELRRMLDNPTSDYVTSRIERIIVDRRIASFAGWYEFFPRSSISRGADNGQPHHRTLRDSIDRLDYVRSLGFDIVYLPPIHPIGYNHRKGVENSPVAKDGDVGSPWAIGSPEGGHCDIHPLLGTFDDFDDLVAATRSYGLELAMDLAFQCSPDHPWVTEHPEWFLVHPDGSIAHAENPPKQYQDIVPFNFDSDHWRELWTALADVVRFWHRRGVRIFRVDNPHTKPFRFWEWLITSVRHEDPGVVFLSEAFSHPDVMLQLSRIGFSVSYTHFPWQHTPGDIENYTTMMLAGDRSEFFRGSSWVNTPDILTDELQQGARQVFESRLILAATLSASYGVYGPVFELQIADAVKGTEEYAHGEKYEVRSWDLESPQSLRGLMTQLNSVRHHYRALQHDRALTFHRVTNPRFVAYTKIAPARRSAGMHSDDPVLTIVNTDHWNVQEGMVTVDPRTLPPHLGDVFVAHDLLSGESYHWRAGDNYVRLDPWLRTAHVFALRPLDHAGDGVRG